MGIYDSAWALLAAGRASAGHAASASITWRFGRSVNVTATAALTGFGGDEPHAADIGFTGYVQNGVHHELQPRAQALFMDNVTEISIVLFCFDAWARGQATAYLWD
jgi:hypothetical protein